MTNLREKIPTKNRGLLNNPLFFILNMKITCF